MNKVKLTWCCQSCGHMQSKWTGSCPTCKEWNTFVEELSAPLAKKHFAPTKPVRINEVVRNAVERLSTKMGELDRIFGSGIVRGSLLLVGGEPGVGKSTLMLQIAAALATSGKTVLYVSGEESIEQTSIRAERLSVSSPLLYLLGETRFESIEKEIEALRPDVVIVDSIQIVYKGDIPSSPGSVVQVREVATEFMRLAKGAGITVFLIGHVTKSGEIAGPRILEHLVDVVLEFEGDRQHGFRLLRALKNRFGPADEIALFQMKEKGLFPIESPSSAFLEERMKEVAGSVVVAGMEGARAFLLEIQALVSPTHFPTPSRKSTGIDANRLSLLLAVLEKRLNFRLHSSDVFVALAGGMKMGESALDLGILMAIASSFLMRPIDPGVVAMGEVGLSGEIRGVSRIEARLKEAALMGFQKAIVPKKNVKGISPAIREKIEIVGVQLVDEAIACFIRPHA